MAGWPPPQTRPGALRPFPVMNYASMGMPFARLQQRGMRINPLPPASTPLSTLNYVPPQPPPAVLPVSEPIVDEETSITQLLMLPEVQQLLDEQERLYEAKVRPEANTVEETMNPLHMLVDLVGDEPLADAGEDGGFKTVSSPHAKLPQNHALPPSPRTHSISLPRMPLLEPVRLPYWGVSASVAAAYAKEGLTEMYPWQVQCLLAKDRGDLKEPIYGGNLVYSAPTSSVAIPHRAAVAELLVLRMVEQRKQLAIIALPFVAMVAEKFQFLQRVWAPAGIHIQAFHREANMRPAHEDATVRVAICTFEKANALLNQMMSEGRSSEVGIVVVDELHMLSDDSRGPLLELFITKLRYMAHKPQLVGLSATLPNLPVVASWLGASLFTTDFRPVQLRQRYVLGLEVRAADGKFERRLPPVPKGSKQHDWQLLYLCKEAFEKHSVLVFCSTKSNCERSAQYLAANLPAGSAADMEERARLLSALRRTGGVDSTLQETIPKGVAFHHAGLTAEERSVLEGGFKAGALRLLCATSTLAAGVNLPARRVVVKEPHYGRNIALDKARYNQMCGRAGRTGLDDLGESFLLSPDTRDDEVVRSLSTAPLTALQSALDRTEDGLCRCVLEGLYAGITLSHDDLHRYLCCTLLAAQKPREVHEKLQRALTYLSTSGFVTQGDTSADPVVLTKLGRACVAASMSPEEALAVLDSLRLASRSLQLNHDLHLTYLVTPVHHALIVDWKRLYDRFKELPQAERGVMAVLGMDVRTLMALSLNANHFEASHTEAHVRARYKRLYAAVVLHGLVTERGDKELLVEWNIPRGSLQALQDTAASFASMVSTFAQHLHWWHFDLLLSSFRDRVALGVQHDLFPLAELLRAVEECTAQKMRVLFKAGFTVPEHFAAATPEQLLSELSAAESYKATQMPNGEIKRCGGDFRLCRLLVRQAKQLAEFVVASHPNLALQAYAPPTPHRTPPNSKSPSPTKPRYAAPILTHTSGSVSALPPFAPPHARLLPPSINVTSFGPAFASASVAAPPQPLAALKFPPVGTSTKPQGRTMPLSFDEHLQPTPKRKKGAAITLPVAPFPYEFRTLTSKADLDTLSSLLKAVPRISWAVAQAQADLPAVGKGNEGAPAVRRVVGIALHWRTQTGSHTVYMPIEEDEEQGGIVRAVRLLNCAPRKVSHDTQAQLRALLERDATLHVTDHLEDPMVAAWTYRSERTGKVLTLDNLVRESVATHTTPYCPSVMHKAVAHAVESMVAMERQALNIIQIDAFRKVEMPLTRVLAEMEVAGLGFDRAEGERMQQLLAEAVYTVVRAIEVCVGHKVEVSSNDQVALLLFSELRHSTEGIRRTKSGKRFSVDAEALEMLSSRPECHPVVHLLMQYRKLEKLSSSFVAPLLHYAVRLPDGSHRLHCSILHTATPTGRLATKDPNLQCTPHDLSSSSEAVRLQVSVRSTIVPREGCVLLAADYAAIELRLVAHFSNDAQLVSIMHMRGVDMFKSIARNIYSHKSEADVQDKQRESAKRIVYGLLYGMGAKSLAEDLHCNLVEATLWQEGFYKAFPTVRPWMERLKSECKSTGYVVTLCGRKRYLPSISANNGQAIAQAERQAVNTVCQGSAADLVKMAMNDIGAQLASRRRQGKGAHLLLQIHDELLLEVPHGEVKEVAALVRTAMETAVRSTGELRVPMVVKLKTGASWEQLQELPASS